MKKRIWLSTAALSLGLVASAANVTVQAKPSTDETWSIYWYLCGSDLESEGGAATEDIAELLDVDLPENVTVVIETGGAAEWQNDTMDPNYLERYVYDSEDFKFIEQVKKANMGSSSTLADFLRFCSTNYPADHEMVLFWNHGGGSTQGVAFDELYNYDSLTLDEMYQAFDSVYDLSKGKPMELIGFDTCLMATIDTANTLSNIANYMVASEEYEPGCGWDYTGWVGALADDPSMDGAELGKYICDTYKEGCEEYDEAEEITLSVTDLGKIDQLVQAYDDLGAEALSNQSENAHFYTEFSRNTQKAENYGGNTASAGYANMVDLGDLVRQNKDNFPQTADYVLTTLDDCVVYKINGPYRKEATGLSCYYSFNRDENDLKLFQNISASGTFSSFYNFCLLDDMTSDMEEYIENYDLSLQDMQTVETFESFSWDLIDWFSGFADDDDYDYDDADDYDDDYDDDYGNHYNVIPVEIDEDGYAMIELDEELMYAVEGVYFTLAYVDEEEDYILWLGTDNNIYMDWDNGIFSDNFSGTWGSIDGHFCYMEIVYEGDDYNLYYVPILLNGEEYQLHVVYDYEYEEYYILGARKGLDDNSGASDRNLVQLQDGDEITTLVYASSYYGDDEEELMEFETFYYEEDSEFYDEDMGDGTFAMMFYVEDCRGNELCSDYIWFTVEDGEIYAEVA